MCDATVFFVVWLLLRCSRRLARRISHLKPRISRSCSYPRCRHDVKSLHDVDTNAATDDGQSKDQMDSALPSMNEWLTQLGSDVDVTATQHYETHVVDRRHKCESVDMCCLSFFVLHCYAIIFLQCYALFGGRKGLVLAHEPCCCQCCKQPD